MNVTVEGPFSKPKTISRSLHVASSFESLKTAPPVIAVKVQVKDAGATFLRRQMRPTANVCASHFRKCEVRKRGLPFKWWEHVMTWAIILRRKAWITEH